MSDDHVDWICAAVECREECYEFGADARHEERTGLLRGLQGISVLKRCNKCTSIVFHATWYGILPRPRASIWISGRRLAGRSAECKSFLSMAASPPLQKAPESFCKMLSKGALQLLKLLSSQHTPAVTSAHGAPLSTKARMSVLSAEPVGAIRSPKTFLKPPPPSSPYSFSPFKSMSILYLVLHGCHAAQLNLSN